MTVYRNKMTMLCNSRSYKTLKSLKKNSFTVNAMYQVQLVLLEPKRQFNGMNSSWNPKELLWQSVDIPVQLEIKSNCFAYWVLNTHTLTNGSGIYFE